jgi:hypothetical protein
LTCIGAFRPSVCSPLPNVGGVRQAKQVPYQDALAQLHNWATRLNSLILLDMIGDRRPGIDQLACRIAQSDR